VRSSSFPVWLTVAVVSGVVGVSMWLETVRDTREVWE